MNTDTHTSGSPVKNHISLKTVFGYSATRRTSFRSWFLVYQRSSSKFPSSTSRKEIDHPASSSSSSTSPPMTSSTVSSESVVREEVGDPCGIDPYPAAVSSKHFEKASTGEIRITPTYRNGCKNSERILWMIEFLNTETHTPVLLMDYL